MSFVEGTATLVVTKKRTHEVSSRRAVMVKVTPKRLEIVSGAYKGEKFNRATGEWLAPRAVRLMLTSRYSLEDRP